MFFNHTAPTDIYTLSLHDALPILMKLLCCFLLVASVPGWAQSSPTINDLPSRVFGNAKLFIPPTSDAPNLLEGRDRKSTRLNSSHSSISYAVFCLKKKNELDVGQF